MFAIKIIENDLLIRQIAVLKRGDNTVNQVNRKPSQELEPEPESTVVTDIDPAELEKVEAIDAPIWEGITSRVIDPDLAEVAMLAIGC